MKRVRIPNYKQLEAYYIYKLLNISAKLNAKAVVWQEVFDNGVPLSNDTIVHIWKQDNYLFELDRVSNFQRYINSSHRKVILLNICHRLPDTDTPLYYPVVGIWML